MSEAFQKKIFTIGHSTQSQNEFLDMVHSENINCIIDVRSMPYSKHAPQFNQDQLSIFLKANEVLYIHFGEEFGARRNDCLVETSYEHKGVRLSCSLVDFEKGVTTPNFLRGVERLENAISQGWNIAFMCSEVYPLECHRFSFLSRYFFERGWNVSHITKDKVSHEIQTVSHEALEKEMIDTYIKQNKIKAILPMLDDYTIEQQRIDAYRVKNLEIGYRFDEANDLSNK